MSSTAPEPAPDHLTPIADAARLLGGSPALYTALLRAGLIQGALIDGAWHVDTGVLAAALAVRGNITTPDNVGLTCNDAAQGHPTRTVGGAA